jgi:hypothetical protein
VSEKLRPFTSYASNGHRIPWKMTLPPGVEETLPTDVVDAMENWWRGWFQRGDWSGWKVCLKAICGLPMNAEEFAFFQEHTGRSLAPAKQMREAWLLPGRRAGKSRVISLLACWISVFCDWREYLSPGEKASVLVLAQDRKSARTVMGYIKALICKHGLLKQLITRETDDMLELDTGARIEVQTASWRSVRGYSCCAILCDEVSFWRDDDGTANPAAEIIAALRPSMSTFPGAMLLCATTPYSRSGIVYSTFQRHWGKDDSDLLVWRGTTRSMNATVPEASAEYGGEFRTDISAFLDRSLIEAAVDTGVTVRPPRPGVQYVSFTDPSSGQADSFTCAIAHREHANGGFAVLDALLEVRAPFNPVEATWQVRRGLPAPTRKPRKPYGWPPLGLLTWEERRESRK